MSISIWSLNFPMTFLLSRCLRFTVPDILKERGRHGYQGAIAQSILAQNAIQLSKNNALNYRPPRSGLVQPVIKRFSGLYHQEGQSVK
jgi:hypothetical protein